MVLKMTEWIIDVKPEIEEEFQKLMKDFPDLYMKIIEQRQKHIRNLNMNNLWHKTHREHINEYNRNKRLEEKYKILENLGKK